MKARMIMLAALLVAMVLLVTPGGATYAGDRPFALVEEGLVNGDVWHSFGTSSYRGAMMPGEAYPVDIPVSLPAGAAVRSARLQVYWTWSHEGSTGVPPEFAVTLDGTALPAGTRHSDRKGSGAYDYPYGLDAWNVTGLATGSGEHHVVVTNTGAAGREVSIYGAALLIVYESTSRPPCQYWVREGTDLLFNTTGISADQATTSTTFEGVPPVARVRSARLTTIVPGADKGESDRNEVFFNDRSLGPVDAASSQLQVAVNATDVLAFLREGTNTLAVQDRGDSMMPGTFILAVVVEADGPALKPVPPMTSMPQDLNGDGVCEDLNGNNRPDFSDIVVFFNAMTWIAANEPVASFDANLNGRIDFNDIVQLFNRL